MGEEELTEWLRSWEAQGAVTRVIGYSVFGSPLYAVHVGDDSPAQQIVTAAMHAREHLTADVVARQVDYTLKNRDRLHGGVWFVPLVNPDGVRLVLSGTQGLEPETARRLERINGGSDFTFWKANGRAVDLNVNFPADWGTGATNVFYPSPESYVGPAPASEPETAALIAFTGDVRPYLTVSYHSKGRVIFWDYGQTGAARARDYRYASAARDATGYRLVDGTLGSAGGYKDYCIQTLGISALTIELFSENYRHPVPYSAANEEAPLIEPLAILFSDVRAEL